MTDISPETVAKMVELVRTMASEAFAGPTGLPTSQAMLADHYRDARAIVAELPKPVDPDLVEARRIAAQTWPPKYLDIINTGDADDSWGVAGILSAIKRGRALEREGK